MKVLGFIFLVFNGGGMRMDSEERVRPAKKIAGSRFQVEVITKE